MLEGPKDFVDGIGCNAVFEAILQWWMLLGKVEGPELSFKYNYT